MPDPEVILSETDYHLYQHVRYRAIFLIALGVVLVTGGLPATLNPNPPHRPWWIGLCVAVGGLLLVAGGLGLRSGTRAWGRLGYGIVLVYLPLVPIGTWRAFWLFISIQDYLDVLDLLERAKYTEAAGVEPVDEEPDFLDDGPEIIEDLEVVEDERDPYPPPRSPWSP